MKIATIAAVALVVSVAGPARAQDREGCEENAAEAKEGDKKNYRTVTGPDGKKTFIIEKAFVVCGKIPRPTVIYAFQPSTINYRWENLKKDFIPLILSTVNEAPF